MVKSAKIELLTMLPDSLTTSPRPVYLLASDEPLLIRDWLDAAREALRAGGYEEILTHTVETGFDWDGLLEDGMSMSLFSALKCHIVRFNSSRPGQVGAGFIGQLCENPPQDTVFILVMPKLEQASRNSAWVKKINQAGELCELKPVYPNQLAAWISERAVGKGISLQPPAAEYLADLTEGNLLASDQELEKLALAFKPNSQISLQQIEDNITRSARYTHYVLLDACLAGQAQRALKILQGLRQEGFLPVQILFALQNALEVLQQLKLAQQQNRLNNGLWQSLRIWKSKQRLYLNALARLSSQQIERGLRGCAKLDRINKGQQQPLYEGDDWLLLHQLVAAFSGLKTQKEYQTA